MKQKGFNEILSDFISEFQWKMFDSMNYASRMSQKRIEDKAHKFIDEYYEEYKPKIYKRVPGRQLHKLVEPVYEVENIKSGRIYRFGIRYNPKNIEGIYFSNSEYHQNGDEWISRDNDIFNFDSGDNGIPDPDWITLKFVNGVHPGYFYDSSTGMVVNHQFRRKSPNSKMQKYFDKEIIGITSNYINDFLLRQLTMYF